MLVTTLNLFSLSSSKYDHLMIACQRSKGREG